MTYLLPSMLYLFIGFLIGRLAYLQNPHKWHIDDPAVMILSLFWPIAAIAYVACKFGDLLYKLIK